MSANITLYTTPYCPYCVRAKQLLDTKQVSYTDIDVSRDSAKRKDMEKKSGQRTVPQIWINDQHIGGCDDLYTLEYKGKLDELLSSN